MLTHPKEEEEEEPEGLLACWQGQEHCMDRGGEEESRKLMEAAVQGLFCFRYSSQPLLCPFLPLTDLPSLPGLGLQIPDWKYPPKREQTGEA